MTTLRKVLIAAAALTLLGTAAFAQSLPDQYPIPLPGSGNTRAGQSEMLIQSHAVTGGTLYICTLKQPGVSGQVLGCGITFVATSP